MPAGVDEVRRAVEELQNANASCDKMKMQNARIPLVSAIGVDAAESGRLDLFPGGMYQELFILHFQ